MKATGSILKAAGSALAMMLAIATVFLAGCGKQNDTITQAEKKDATIGAPAPDGPIYLVMRLYWPKTEAPSILPVGKGTWSPPGIVLAK